MKVSTFKLINEFTLSYIFSNQRMRLGFLPNGFSVAFLFDDFPHSNCQAIPVLWPQEFDNSKIRVSLRHMIALAKET